MNKEVGIGNHIVVLNDIKIQSTDGKKYKTELY
jgi:hypothetical protein